MNEKVYLCPYCHNALVTGRSREVDGVIEIYSGFCINCGRETELEEPMVLE